MADAVKSENAAQGGQGGVIGSPNGPAAKAASYAVKTVSAPPLTGGETGAGAWGASRPASASFSKVSPK